MRGYARSVAFSATYAYLMGEMRQDIDYSFFEEPKLTDEDKQFALSVLNAVKEHRAQLDDVVSKIAQGYTLDRINKIDLSAIYVAIAESLYLGTPFAVAANEAVSIVKVYSTAKSQSFVNGILGEYARRLKNE